MVEDASSSSRKADDLPSDQPAEVSETVAWDANLARLLAPPVLTATLKQTPADFQVDEILGFDADEEGNHWLLHVRKIGRNTSELIEFLANSSDCSEGDVGFCGLKDRQATTTQWCTIPIGRATAPVDPTSFDWPEGFELLSFARHGKKLRRGIHRGNRFRIVLRDIAGSDPDWDNRLKSLGDMGFPNYFSEQRFGRDGSNLALIARMGEVGAKRRWNRRDRNWGLSSLRAQIFNQVLSKRLADDSFQRVLDGDVVNLVGSRSWFVADAKSLTESQERLAQHDIALTGPLWGSGALQASGEAKALEQAVADGVLDSLGRDNWLDLLQRWRVEPDRRPLLIRPEGLTADFGQDAATLTLGFSLPRGSYATSLLRELVEVRDST